LKPINNNDAVNKQGILIKVATFQGFANSLLTLVVSSSFSSHTCGMTKKEERKCNVAPRRAITGIKVFLLNGS